MTTPDRTRSTALALAVVATAALASFTPSTAAAADYDMDCKLILCLPGGFPSGCGDAFDHMIDRLRDGKSPIGFCAMSNGAEYDAYEIDYDAKSAADPEGWECPTGKTLYHRVHSDDDRIWSRTVNTFCYEDTHERRGWTPDGYDTVTTYTNKTPPERRNLWVNLILEPGTPDEFSQGWQKFDTGRPSAIRVRYTE